MKIPLTILAIVVAYAGFASPTTANASLDGAEFVVGSEVFMADFSMSSSCSGPAMATLTIHKPGGDDVRQVAVDSLILPQDCFVMNCLDCPPVPMPMTWTVRGPGVDLAGGGVIYYEQYGFWELAWTLTGPFQEGWLEAHGAIN